MEKKKVDIKSATQISMQQPLSEEWMETPVVSHDAYVRSLDPNFREWLNPLESRRMGKILKRALVTAQKAMDDADVTQPDAVITGTGLGCIENTELLLDQLCRQGEQMLKPTYFMQSSHNTISSLISIYHHLHGYNTTYSHKAASFDAALLDAYTQLTLGDINTALVTANDELTPSYFNLLRKVGYLGQPNQVPATETSVAMVLTTSGEGALCEVEHVAMAYSANGATFNDGLLATLPSTARACVDHLVLGTNGTADNDQPYQLLSDGLPQADCIHYKRLFGENYSASALGVYAAAHLLEKGKARHLLFANHSAGTCLTLVALKAVNS